MSSWIVFCQGHSTTVYLCAEVAMEFKIYFADSFDICVFHLVQPSLRFQYQLKSILLFGSIMPIWIAPRNSGQFPRNVRPGQKSQHNNCTWLRRGLKQGRWCDVMHNGVPKCYLKVNREDTSINFFRISIASVVPIWFYDIFWKCL